MQNNIRKFLSSLSNLQTNCHSKPWTWTTIQRSNSSLNVHSCHTVLKCEWKYSFHWQKAAAPIVISAYSAYCITLAYMFEAGQTYMCVEHMSLWHRCWLRFNPSLHIQRWRFHCRTTVKNVFWRKNTWNHCTNCPAWFILSGLMDDLVKIMQLAMITTLNTRI